MICRAMALREVAEVAIQANNSSFSLIKVRQIVAGMQNVAVSKNVSRSDDLAESH